MVIIDAGRISWALVTVQSAARAGARYAGSGNSGCQNPPDRESLLDGSEIWSFSFFSPGSKKTANTSVNDGKAQIINQGSLGSSIQPSPVDGWAVDSSVAILRMLDEGGDKFLNENQIISMTMALTAGAERGRPEWLVSVLGSRDGRYYNVRLDASNGEVLDAFGSS